MRPLMLGIFPVLFALSWMCIFIFVFRFIVPMWRSGNLNVEEHKLPIGVALLCVSLMGETLIYGLGRILPSHYVSFSNIFEITLTLKVLYVIGLTFLVSWDIKARTGKKTVHWLVWVILLGWVLVSAGFAIYD